MAIQTDGLMFDLLSSDPVSPAEGQFWYNTTTRQLKVYHDAATQIVRDQQPNLAAVTNPGVGNDTTQGYSVGSTWINTATKQEFTCTDATTGAAVWKSTTIVYPATNEDTILSGGASWDSGLTFNVSALTYIINGTYYASAAGQVTLATAHATLNRIDVIYANTSGAIGVITGTPSASPAKPMVGPTQIEVTFATVNALQTTPAGVSVTNVYLENAGTGGGEWNVAESTGAARIALASTSNPYQGTKDIEATNAVNGDMITFTPAAPFDTSAQTNLEFALRAKSTWSAGERIWISLYNTSGSPMSTWLSITDGSYGFSVANTTSYQIISIPKTAFLLSSATIGSIRIYVQYTLGFYLDRMRWMAGMNITSISSNDTFALHSNIANEISALAIKATPVAADLLLIEDSAAGFVKKRVTVGTLPYPEKATAAELNAGTDNAKFATALGIENSKYLDQDGTKTYAVATGTNTYAVTLAPALTAYAAGNTFIVKFTNANTGAATVNVNALGAKSIVKGAATELVSGDILAGSLATIAYNGTNFLLNFKDTTAIHSNVSGEINALTTKASPVAADVIVIEDSAESFAKKKATLTSVMTLGTTLTTSVTTATGTITTTSTTPVLATLLTVTPGTGTYLVFFTGACCQGTTGSGLFIETSIYSNNVQNAASRIRTADAITFPTPFTNIGVITITGSQTIEGRWSVTAGSGTANMLGTRTLTTLKIG